MTRPLAFLALAALLYLALRPRRPEQANDRERPSPSFAGRELCRDPACVRDLAHDGPHRPSPSSWTGTRIDNNGTAWDSAPWYA